LFTVVLLHGMLIQQRKNTWHRLVALFGLLPWLFVMYSSFLTRSGILENFSVHSFAKEDDLFPYLIGPLCFFWILGVGMWLFRWKNFPVHKVVPKPWSAAQFVYWAVGLISVFAMLVWLGMSSPLITGMAAGLREAVPSLKFLPTATSNVGTGYYNTIATPIAILGALMMAMIPLLSWQRSDLERTWKKAVIPYLLACIVVGLAAAYGVGRDRPPFELWRWGTGAEAYRLVLPAQVPLLSLIFAGAMSLFMSLQTVFLTPKKIGRLGAFLSHAGIGLLLIGVVASELADKEQRAALVKGEPQQVMGYTVLYNGMYVPPGHEKPALDLTFTRDGEKFKAPTPMYFSNFNRQYNYAPYIQKYSGHDLYIAPEGPPMTTKEMAQRPVELLVGQQSETINGVSVKFDRFAVAGQPGETIRVGAVVDVVRDGSVERVEPYWQASPGQERQSVEVKTKDGQVTLEIGDLNADAKSVTLVVGGHALGEPMGPPQEIALLSISTKPMINLVWLATLMVLCGGLLTVSRAFGDMSRAEARDRDSYEELEDPAEEDALDGRMRKRVPHEKEAVAGAHLAEGTANP
ncbi:MAG: hypothetical protein KY468_18395, partial [Armatimonadetes bacterium]|nr:hypothetical protein [Armatimonadota bacterium]